MEYIIASSTRICIYDLPLNVLWRFLVSLSLLHTFTVTIQVIHLNNFILQAFPNFHQCHQTQHPPYHRETRPSIAKIRYI